MPKMIDTVKEAQILERALQKGEEPRRQFVFRLNVGPAVQLIRRCNYENKQPGPLIEEILTEVFETWNLGVHLRFPSLQLQVLDRIALLKGVSREDVVRQLVTDHLAELLNAELTRDSETKEALKAADTKKKVAK